MKSYTSCEVPDPFTERNACVPAVELLLIRWLRNYFGSISSRVFTA